MIRWNVWEKSEEWSAENAAVIFTVPSRSWLAGGQWATLFFFLCHLLSCSQKEKKKLFLKIVYFVKALLFVNL